MTCMSLMGTACITLYILDLAPSFLMEERFMPFIMKQVLYPTLLYTGISPFFMPFLLNWGLLESVGVLFKPILRPLFKLPGRAAVITVSAFFGSAPVGIITVDNLYKDGRFTHKEAFFMGTSFSTTAISFMVILSELGEITEFWGIYFFACLAGLALIAIVMVVAAPYCAMMLANMGAEVIKIEKPGGGDISRENIPQKDGISTYYIAYNNSKSGMCIDLKSGKGKEILTALIKESDILIENFRPGVMEQLGFGYKKVSGINKRIVYASISGYGQDGDYALRASFDPIAQAVSGMLSVTGEVKGNGFRCGASIADVLAGQNAAFAILAALMYREKSGKGQWIDIALADSCISALTSINQIYLTTGEIPSPMGNGFEASAPGNCYPAKDGNIMILAGTNKEWKRLAAALKHPEWLQDERFLNAAGRVENRAALDGMIREQTAQYEVRDLMKMLLEYKLPVSEVRNIAQVVNDPYFSEKRKMFVDVDHPVLGSVKVTNLPIHMSDTQPYIRKCAPLLGQDTEKILDQLGYREEDIKNLRMDGVI